MKAPPVASTGMLSHPREIAAVMIAGNLPLLSYPLSWLPFGVAQLRFGFAVPIPEIALVIGLAWLSRIALTAESVNKITIADRDFLQTSIILLPVALLVLSWVISVRFSAHPFLSVNCLPELAGNLAIFVFAILFPKSGLRKLATVWVAVAVVVALNGLLRAGTDSDFVSTLGNRNFLGAYLAVSLILALSFQTKWAWLAAIVLAVGLFSCGSRGAWLALAGTAALWFVCCRGGENHLSTTGRFIVVILVLATASFTARGYIVRQWQSDVRPEIWKSTVAMIKARPFIGHGLGTFFVEYPQFRRADYFLRPKATNVTDHAHNEYLEVAAEQGFLGLIATGWIWGACLWRGYRRWSTSEGDRWQLGFLGAAIVFLLHGMVDVDLRFLPNGSLLWLILGLCHAGGAKKPAIHIKSRSSRILIAGACLVIAGWVTVMAIGRPMLADWRDRTARLAEMRGDLDTAALTAWRALEIQPLRISTRYFLAGVLSRIPKSKAHELAIEQCLRIEELAPGYADVTFNLGQLYLQQQQPGDALPFLERAVKTNPDHAGRRVALAAALLRLGKPVGAQEQLEAALNLDPGNNQARTLLNALKESHQP